MENEVQAQSASEILDKYGTMVFRTAYAMVKNQHDAEDIAQDVFVSFVRTKPVFTSEDHQKAWLLRVTINRSKSFLRSAWQRRTEGLPETLPDELLTPRENMVMEAVALLPVKYRQVIYLYYIEGYSSVELAKLLGLPQNTVLSRLARARKHLAKTLEGEFDHVEG
ncbi:sigma-70 family RNA polymerase sigma factor [uncultured Ruthenibacterium sp.]|uniref:sigma-70 family RNA polymerase sigma factor n=1 Tax=uncultured Ruthenibacterium sp. TaxID=1905347 RepID=UPI00349E6076